MLLIAVLGCNTVCPPSPKEKIYSDYQSYMEEALQYCKSRNLNTSFFFLADLSVHSGIKRLYLCDFSEKKIAERYMVSHGCGSHFWKMDNSRENAEISNEPESHCSSVGKYIIGNKGVSEWGIKINYQLAGMDKTNSNASKRNIVLHSWNAVPENEVYPDGVPEGWGCPAVSNHSLKKMIKNIESEEKRTLLWLIRS